MCILDALQAMAAINPICTCVCVCSYVLLCVCVCSCALLCASVCSCVLSCALVCNLGVCMHLCVLDAFLATAAVNHPC